MEFHIAQQCCLASISAPINKFMKGFAVKVVQTTCLYVIHGPNYLNFNLIFMGVKNGIQVVSRKYNKKRKQASTACRKLDIFVVSGPCHKQVGCLLMSSGLQCTLFFFGVEGCCQKFYLPS